jgi:hypothetical protein
MLLIVLFSSVLYADEAPGRDVRSQAPRLLLVTVLQTSDAVEAGRLLATRPDAAVITAPVRRIRTTADSGDGSRAIRVQVLEGESAQIDLHHSEPVVRLLWVEEVTTTGEPLPAVELTSEEFTEGFHVRAQLSGKVVTLRLEAYSTPVSGSQHSRRLTHNLETTVVGRLGRWMDLGGSLQAVAGAAGSHSYRVHHGQVGRMHILARVDLAPGE